MCSRQGVLNPQSAAHCWSAMTFLAVPCTDWKLEPCSLACQVCSQAGANWADAAWALSCASPDCIKQEQSGHAQPLTQAAHAQITPGRSMEIFSMEPIWGPPNIKDPCSRPASMHTKYQYVTTCEKEKEQNFMSLPEWDAHRDSTRYFDTYAPPNLNIALNIVDGTCTT